MSSVDTTDRTRRRPSGMRILIAISLAVHIPLFIYPVLRLCDWLQLSPLTTILLLMPIASSQIISRWLLRDVKQSLARGLRHAADFVLGLSPILLITLLAFEFIVLLGLVDAWAAAVSVLGISLFISVAGLLFALIPMVKTVTFESSLLTVPLRFVQITDVHIGSRSKAFLDQVVRKVQALQPEFLCITGDLIDATGVTEEDLAALRTLDCPIYFTIGNHERYEDLEDILARLRGLGVRVLRTDTIHPREDVQVLGIDDRDDALQVKRELAKLAIEREAFGILMYHRPHGLEAAADAGIDLMISGHTHNGQIFPFNLVVNRVFERVVGLYQLGASRLYVSQGTGTWGPVMRVGTRSEITLFEIESIEN
ncbi:MAG: metallophosphoesterase [Candidatus Azotimanducaceae bacterium WSBS_2022_MAG_OTU7]